MKLINSLGLLLCTRQRTLLKLRLSYFFNSFCIAHVENIIAADECLANIAFALAIDPLFSVEQLQVHVAVKRNQDAFVLHAPLQLYDDWLVNQVNQEWLWVDWNRLMGVRLHSRLRSSHLFCFFLINQLLVKFILNKQSLNSPHILKFMVIIIGIQVCFR